MHGGDTMSNFEKQVNISLFWYETVIGAPIINAIPGAGFIDVYAIGEDVERAFAKSSNKEGA